MMKHNFNHWIARRSNEINEGLFDWLWKKKVDKESEKEPTNPLDIQKNIYNNHRVKQYVDIVLDHMGLQPGIILQQVDPKTNTLGTDIKITNWATQNPKFYTALQRFVAGHVIGGGTDKTYLRISQHDAVTILKTLDQYHRKGENQSVLEDMGIDSPLSLADWMQTKLPTQADAVKQMGYDSTSFRKRSSPLNNPNIVRGLIRSGEEVVRQGLGRRHFTVGLRDALIALNNELMKVGSNVEPIPIEPKKTKKPVGPDPTITGTGPPTTS